jgi:hypothetical protein
VQARGDYGCVNRSILLANQLKHAVALPILGSAVPTLPTVHVRTLLSDLFNGYYSSKFGRAAECGGETTATPQLPGNLLTCC